jgi:hypothetical protein
MRQGQASSSGPAGRKIEPRSHAVSPAGVSQIGEAMGNHATDVTENLHGSSEALYSGRGFEAPRDAGRTIHHGGSQGKR